MLGNGLFELKAEFWLSIMPLLWRLRLLSSFLALSHVVMAQKDSKCSEPLAVRSTVVDSVHVNDTADVSLELHGDWLELRIVAPTRGHICFMETLEPKVNTSSTLKRAAW